MILKELFSKILLELLELLTHFSLQKQVESVERTSLSFD